MKTLVVGFAFLGLAGLLLTSPYWLFREIVRPGDEPLPPWMGDARVRKKRLAVAAGALALVGGGGVVAAGLFAA